IITSISLLILISGTMIFQSLYFEQFYTYRKVKKLTNNIDKFRASYSFDISNDLMLYRALENFEDANSSKIAIYDYSGKIKYIADSNKENSRDVLLLNALFNRIFTDKNYIEAVKSSDKAYVSLISSNDKATDYIIGVAPFSFNTKNDSMLVSLASVQPINEASEAIRELFVYIFAAAFILVIILSFVYSNMISKPLIKLNKEAKQLSSLDFNVKCDSNRDDEIGSLAESLNFLSQNLSDALVKLQEQNKKLQDDIEKERALEKMRKEFIAAISHDLKTPISIIKGYAEGLKDNIADESSKDFYLEVILDETENMETLIKDMLDLSYLESGYYKLNIENFDINHLINNSISRFNDVYKEKNLKLQLDLCTPSMVQGDSFRIEQVINNLLSNAYKYTPHNENILINTQAKNNKLTFSIENYGTSIPEEELNNIWDKFYKLNKSRSRSQENGTGLGLAIVKNILVLHQSDFSVENTEKGVKFSFQLPLSDN
uniref:sensor histidine kinase n=1 Tax=Clostridium polynesiense TaxID=1325933 RepID=UPI000590B75A